MKINKTIGVIASSAIAIMAFSGCSAKRVPMKSLVPADVPVLLTKRSIAVVNMKGDNVNLSSKIESDFAKVTLNKKPFFKVLNRAQLDKILREQKLQASDLSDGSSATKIGKLIGAQAIIGGSVTTTHEDGSYIEQRERCVASDKKGHCVRSKTYNVTCPTASASVSASINVIDVETARNIYAQTITKDYSADGCKVSAAWGLATTDGKIKTSSQALVDLSDVVANDFVVKFAPRYVVYSVELMEDVDSVDLNDKQKKQFKNALTYIQNGRIEKAEQILDKLYAEVGEKAFEVAYDLGLVKQSLGKYKEAKSLFTSADKNTSEPSKLLDHAILNIDAVIKKQKEAEEQMKQK